jgi:hypothetical protein
MYGVFGSFRPPGCRSTSSGEGVTTLILGFILSMMNDFTVYLTFDVGGILTELNCLQKLRR